MALVRNQGLVQALVEPGPVLGPVTALVLLQGLTALSKERFLP